MNDDRDVKVGRQLKERQRLVIVRILALKARRDPGSQHSILFDRTLELPQKAVATPGHRYGEGENRRMLRLQ